MERSSPLAAMRPPSMPGPWGLCHDAHLAPPPPFPGRGRFGPDGFNFKDLSMKRSSSSSSSCDYFTLKPVRGSSPTASLAADLSQNFHIDQRYVCTRARARARDTPCRQRRWRRR